MIHQHVKIPLLLILLFIGLANKALTKNLSSENSEKIANFLRSQYPSKSVTIDKINKISPSKLLKSQDGKILLAHLKTFNDSVKTDLDSILKYCKTKYHVNGFKNKSYLKFIRNRSNLALVRYFVGRGPFKDDVLFFIESFAYYIPKVEEERLENYLNRFTFRYRGAIHQIKIDTKYGFSRLNLQDMFTSGNSTFEVQYTVEGKRFKALICIQKNGELEFCTEQKKV
jgi:hypothetical protein